MLISEWQGHIEGDYAPSDRSPAAYSWPKPQSMVLREVEGVGRHPRLWLRDLVTIGLMRHGFA